MNEMILNWPNVALHWWDNRGSHAGFRLIPEIEKGQYGYRLTVGQTLHAIMQECIHYRDCQKVAADHFRIMACPSCERWEWRGLEG